MLSELHRHLDGSLRLETFKTLAQKYNVSLPDTLHFTPKMGLEKALELFQYSLACLQNPEDVKLVASEMCEDAREENLSKLEIRFAPFLHKGAPPEEIIEAALDGITSNTGLILCILYGEDPKKLIRMVEWAKDKKGVVGIDIAGAPSWKHAWDITDYYKPYELAEKYGLGRTIHVGEGRSAEEIIEAIRVLRVQRIGHGTTLLSNFQALDLVLKREIVVETCITSNYHTGAVGRIAQHSLPTWLKYGVKATLCADNTLFSQTNVVKEYEVALTLPNVERPLLNQAIQNGFEGSFI